MSALVHRTAQDGTVLVGSDGHYWPGVPVPAHDAFVERAADLSMGGHLVGVVYNGDALDAARISRHARIGWENLPHVHEELDEVLLRMGEIEEAVRHSAAWLDWPLGNHDMRFETRLSAAAPEYEHIRGTHLKDHFPAWTPSWGVVINGGVVVKHRLKGGVHARWNNVVSSGVTILTGHTHRLGVTAYTDYAGTRWGVETGMLGNPHGPQFGAYTEAGPVNWQQGWVELEFEDGRLMWPRVVYVEV